ncbi:MAG TPA: xylulokinase [Bryobacteraceae bacterium]|nr:xylulokinase [Bryobacteraceae bacterium]
MSGYWLGVDIGTGGSRALLVDEAGRIVAGRTEAHADMRMERPLWAEQDPDDWWRAAQVAIRGALDDAGIAGSAVRGVSLSGQMHGLVILDATGTVIRPSLIWCDQRSQSQVDAINAKAGREQVLAAIANPVLTGFTLPKLLWVRDHEPASYERVRHLLLPKDYIRYRLTGEFASEVSDASGTALFDVVNRRWALDFADTLGIDRSILPTVYESEEITGTISPHAALVTGLTAGTPVIGGGGDQAASAVGNGIVAPGLVSDTIGTSGVVFAHMDEVAYDPQGRVHTFCHAVRGKWHVMGVTQGAGLSLQWFRTQLAADANYDSLTAQASESPAGARGLFWLPYLMGERTPHLDSQCRAAWVGLTAAHTRGDMARALLEGVCFSQKDCLDIITGLGCGVETVRLSGGGAKSAFWKQLFADVFGKPVSILETQEGSAYGAALLAMVGTGVFSSVVEACGVAVREVETIAPGANSAYYPRAHAVYSGLYPALRESFHAISGLA